MESWRTVLPFFWKKKTRIEIVFLECLEKAEIFHLKKNWLTVDLWILLKSPQKWKYQTQLLMDTGMIEYYKFQYFSGFLNKYPTASLMMLLWGVSKKRAYVLDVCLCSPRYRECSSQVHYYILKTAKQRYHVFRREGRRAGGGLAMYTRCIKVCLLLTHGVGGAGLGRV